MSLREALSGEQAHNPERKIERRQSERSESSISSSIRRTTSQLGRSSEIHNPFQRNIYEKRVVLFGKVVNYVNNFEVIITQVQPQKQKEEKTDDVCSRNGSV